MTSSAPSSIGSDERGVANYPVSFPNSLPQSIMATPFEFVARELQLRYPDATVEPAIDGAETPRRDLAERIYRSGENGAFGDDYSTVNLRMYNGYPYYYPMHLTHPGQRPLKVRIAPGFNCIQRFTRPRHRNSRSSEPLWLLAH